MTPLENLLSAAPPSFTIAVDAFNQWLPFAKPSQDLTKLLHEPNTPASKALKFLLNALNHSEPTSVSTLSAVLSTCTDIRAEAAPHLAAWLVEQQLHLLESNKESRLLTGRLRELNWKVGVAVDSSIGEGVMQPFVTLDISAADAHGSPTRHIIELSVKEFYALRNQVRRAKESMSTQ